MEFKGYSDKNIGRGNLPIVDSLKMEERVSLRKPLRSTKQEHLLLQNEIDEINAMALSREISAPISKFNKQTKIEKKSSNNSTHQYPAFRKSSQASSDNRKSSEFQRIDSFQTCNEMSSSEMDRAIFENQDQDEDLTPSPPKHSLPFRANSKFMPKPRYGKKWFLLLLSLYLFCKLV